MTLGRCARCAPTLGLWNSPFHSPRPLWEAWIPTPPPKDLTMPSVSVSTLPTVGTVRPHHEMLPIPKTTSQNSTNRVSPEVSAPTYFVRLPECRGEPLGEVAHCPRHSGYSGGGGRGGG
uniref:Uncharacterized protein n=1 Tax=Mustela putorius furo TaxID=9669 RepID=M3XZX6_MUSPF